MQTEMAEKILTKDFVLIFFAQAAFLSVVQLLVPTLPIYLSRLGYTEVEIGFFVGVFGVTSVVLRPFVGRALVTIPEKKFMMAAALISAFTSIAYLFVFSFWPLLIARVFQGIAFAVFHTAALTLIANISSGGNRAQRISYFALAMNVSATLAPPLGMFLINRFSFTHLFSVCAGLSLCSFLLGHRLPRKHSAPLRDFSSEKGFFVSRKAIPPSVVMSFSFFIWGAITAFFPLYAIHHGVTNPGLFFATVAFMVVLGRSLGVRQLAGRNRAIIILTCLSAHITSMVILTFSQTLPLFLLAAVFWGSGHAFIMPFLMDDALDRSGSAAGPAMGTFTAVADLGLFLGPFTMGVVLHYTTYPIMFFCLALVGFVNFNYFYFLVRRKK
jgi:predicted MFS family arabinose efflux permease